MGKAVQIEYLDKDKKVVCHGDGGWTTRIAYVTPEDGGMVVAHGAEVMEWRKKPKLDFVLISMSEKPKDKGMGIFLCGESGRFQFVGMAGESVVLRRNGVYVDINVRGSDRLRITNLST